jgi:hypothetical protein
VDIAVIPAEDAGAIFPAKIDLPLADHVVLPRANVTGFGRAAWMTSAAIEKL